MTDTATRSLTSLYVHIPFCAHKCGYCDFNSWAEEGKAAQELWLQSIKQQMRWWGERLFDFEIDTIFFGGGTPSLLQNSILVQLLAELRSHFRLRENVEWTVECNPETLTEEKLELMQVGGVNRLSLGIQSFDDDYLKRLERRARRKHNEEALELVVKHWKGRWSMDLMFGLPSQSLAKSQEDLEIALDFGMQHLSVYQLTLLTQRSKAWSQPPEDALLAMFDQTEEMLADKGLERYEVSNFAIAGEECRHNLRYWQLESFVGIGPGAAGLLPRTWPDVLGGGDVKKKHPDNNIFGYHQRQPESFEKWRKAALVGGAGTLTPRTVYEHFEEILMMGLRLKKGICETRFRGWPVPPELFFEKALRSGTIEKHDEYWVVSSRGLRILDTLLLDFFEDIRKFDLSNLDLGDIDPTFR